MAYTFQSFKQWWIDILKSAESLNSQTCKNDITLKKQQQQGKQGQDASSCLTGSLLVESLDINTTTKTMATTQVKTKPLTMVTKDSVIVQPKETKKEISCLHDSIATILPNKGQQQQQKANAATTATAMTAAAAATVVTNRNGNKNKTNITNNVNLADIDDTVNVSTSSTTRDQEQMTTAVSKDEAVLFLISDGYNELSEETKLINTIGPPILFSAHLATSSSSTSNSGRDRYDEYYHGYSPLVERDNRHDDNGELNEINRHRDNILYNDHFLPKQNRRSCNKKRYSNNIISQAPIMDAQLAETYYNNVVVRYTLYNLPAGLKK